MPPARKGPSDGTNAWEGGNLCPQDVGVFMVAACVAIGSLREHKERDQAIKKLVRGVERGPPFVPATIYENEPYANRLKASFYLWVKRVQELGIKTIAGLTLIPPGAEAAMRKVSPTLAAAPPPRRRGSPGDLMEGIPKPVAIICKDPPLRKRPSPTESPIQTRTSPLLSSVNQTRTSPLLSSVNQRRASPLLSPVNLRSSAQNSAVVEVSTSSSPTSAVRAVAFSVMETTSPTEEVEAEVETGDYQDLVDPATVKSLPKVLRLFSDREKLFRKQMEPGETLEEAAARICDDFARPGGGGGMVRRRGKRRGPPVPALEGLGNVDESDPHTEEDGIFDVTDIKGCMRDPDNPEKFLFLVRWASFGPQDDTWEDEDSLQEGSSLVLACRYFVRWNDRYKHDIESQWPLTEELIKLVKDHTEKLAREEQEEALGSEASPRTRRRQRRKGMPIPKTQAIKFASEEEDSSSGTSDVFEPPKTSEESSGNMSEEEEESALEEESAVDEEESPTRLRPKRAAAMKAIQKVSQRSKVKKTPAKKARAKKSAAKARAKAATKASMTTRSRKSPPAKATPPQSSSSTEKEESDEMEKIRKYRTDRKEKAQPAAAEVEKATPSYTRKRNQRMVLSPPDSPSKSDSSSGSRNRVSPDESVLKKARPATRTRVRRPSDTDSSEEHS